VREVAALWPATAGGGRVLAGEAADEATFKREAPRHRALHLATHGFFLREGCTSAVAGTRGIGGLAPAAPATGRAVSLRLSGLALAGANQRAAAGASREDGILTAEEISSLDLSGVERVVLSACHSGVGDVVGGLGVTGLRRAFRVAGARTLVMSLWSVDDRASAAWMRALYAAWADGAGTGEAVRRASLERLEARRRAGESTHPLYWGAFVAVGAR
jgi:CHAT domain-containing protein